MSSDYKSTLHLPRTDFPMRANLPQAEPARLAQWERDGLYDQIQKAGAGRPKYILHDGPPYANGHIHIGHALNKILKDIIVRLKTMSGYVAPYVPGWDCHGLPIEHQVLKARGAQSEAPDAASLLDIRKRCRKYAEEFIAIQREEFQRLGVLGDWAHPYLTLTPDYEAEIVRALGRVMAAGGVYKGKKPVLWCPHDRTALAEAEVEYADHATPSVYVKFPLAAPQDQWPQLLDQPLPSDVTAVSLVIWTTTPWTLPANQALCVHPDFDYLLIQANREVFIVAAKRAEAVAAACGWKMYHPLGAIKGAALEGWVCHRPLPLPPLDKMNPGGVTSPIVLGTFVTLDQGTGVVHIAPGHGQEDFQLTETYPNLEVFAPVDARGRFTDEVGEADLVGKNVFDANPLIIEKLVARGLLLGQETLTHSYPHCWRCKQPVIFRATEQWFISMETADLRARAIAAIEGNVRWIPKWGQDRILGMMTARPDWCISRQRAWGVPIVAFTCLACRTPRYSQAIAEHVANLMAQGEGSDIWFSKTADELLPPGTTCSCGERRFVQENDILDVWFESGASHAAVLKQRPELAWPADLYLEGSDQHRGWFHSSLLVALSTDGAPPYKAVLTHGFTVDGAGKKMSKSAGNVVAPQEIIREYGAEILRLWVAATDFRDDVRISRDILVQLSEAYRKIRNTCRFLLGNLSDYDPAGAPPDLHELDRWALHRLDLFNEKVQRAYHDFEFHIVFHALNNFCAVDLSSFYLDILKDRLYAGGVSDRRAAQAVLHETLVTLARLMAPILVFTSEEIWAALPPQLKPEGSVHLALFTPPGGATSSQAVRHPELAEPWARMTRVREEVARHLEAARKEKRIGNSLEAAVHIAAAPALLEFLKEKASLLPSLFIVSQVDLSEAPTSAPEMTVVVSPARGAKCERCWVYDEQVGASALHPTLCPRCVGGVAG
jgi:isoleucyl-tRNA synthetase